MEDLNDVLDVAYRLVGRDRPAAIRCVCDEIDLFREESLRGLGPLAFNGATNDPLATRATKLSLLGDLFLELTEGPVPVFRELALRIYDTALNLEPLSAPLSLKSGAAWLQRINGDREYNLGKAIQQLDRCLNIAPAEALRIRGLANNLMGLALSDAASGADRTAFREAEAHFNDALSHFQQLADDSLQAMVHLNLGNLYASAAHPALAISQYRNALGLYIRLNHVGDVALAERNLGVTLLDQVDQQHSEDVEEAIRYLKSSLSRIQESHDPHGFAVTLNNIGRAYALRIVGNQDENFAAASDAFEHAAARFRELGEITNARIAYASAGGIQYELKRWAAALRQFKLAIDQLEREWQGKLTAQSRLHLDHESASIFDFAVLSAINDANRREAICLLEQGRQKLLVEAYYSKGVHPRQGSCSGLWQRAEILRHKRTSLEQEVTCYRLSNSFRSPATRIENLRAEVEDLRAKEQDILQVIKTQNPGFLPTTTALEPDQIATLAARLNANLCAAKPTAKGTIVFVFTPNGKIHDALLEDAPLKYWQELLFGQNGWAPAYEGFRSHRPFALYRWLKIMSTTLNETFRVLISKCLSLLSLPTLGQTGLVPAPLPRIYFLAGGPLELLPLHAAFWEDGQRKRYLADIADIGYFSSFRLLADASERLARFGVGQKVTILRAPERELSFMRWEAAFASQIFGEDVQQVFFRSSSKAEGREQFVLAGMERSMLLITCHALANPTDGLRSGLFFSSLSDGGPDMSIADLLGIELKHCTLALLSACETSLKEIQDPPDECLSLANAFLAAGAAGAIGTQWAANDVASALWTARFLLRSRINHGDALQSACEASRWIKDSLPEEKAKLLDSCKEALPNGYAESLHKDFAHPFFWANHKFYGASLRSAEAQQF